MGEYDDLVDSLWYCRLWVHKRRQTEPIHWKSEVLGRYYWDSDGDRLPVPKGTMKNKLRIEFSTLLEARRCIAELQGLHGVYIENTHRTMEVTLYGTEDSWDNTIQNVFNILLNIKASEWQIVGPRCPEIARSKLHERDDVNMLWVSYDSPLKG